MKERSENYIKKNLNSWCFPLKNKRQKKLTEKNDKMKLARERSNKKK